MTRKQKGKCFVCGADWYWCQECGAAGCMTDGCAQQRSVQHKGGILSWSGSKCRVCGSS
jgi:hypothetical protein